MSFRYRDFKVYRDAIKAYKFVVDVTRGFSAEYLHLKDQMRRAALSVILNIAEGSSKTTDINFNRYLGNSLGSTNEVVAALEVAHSVQLIAKEQFDKGTALYESIANQLGGFSKFLKSNN